MQEIQRFYEAWNCLNRQISTCSQKDLPASKETMSHFLEFGVLVGIVASIANVIGLMVARQPSGSLKTSLLAVC